MIKTYRKIATIKAEQFDGSSAMLKKYGAYFASKYPCYENSDGDYLIKTKEVLTKLNMGDWIATGVADEYWVIKDSIFRRTYVEVE
ncbi:MAG: hypothetical protein LIV28_09740 [Lactobacillus sp.]|nr:hypothetical protein [Lactobacillus sp.]